MQKQADALIGRLQKEDLQARVVSIVHLEDLERSILARHEDSQFDENFYQERLTFFDFKPPSFLPEACSLIVVAVPRPQSRLHFEYHGRSLDLVLPPTYMGHREVIDRTSSRLADQLTPAGYRIAPARLPQKLLAVCSGLAEYGRNNITYVEGLGSFHQPVVFFSDLPADPGDWREPVWMARCLSCKACLVKCPTGAIREDRFLLYAERCLVYHNERGTEWPFPDWIDPESHDSIMGCMRCQQVCPVDKPFLEWFEENEQFDEEETGLLLAGVDRDHLPPEMLAKLGRLELVDDLGLLPRNLGVFFRQSGTVKG